MILENAIPYSLPIKNALVKKLGFSSLGGKALSLLLSLILPFPVSRIETSMRSRSSHAGATLAGGGGFPRSLSPSGRFCSSSMSSSTGGFYHTARSESRHDALLTRATSPTRVSLGRSVSPSSLVRFSASRQSPISSQSSHRSLNSGAKKTCMCSPTTHPGSFRCSLHKNSVLPGYSHSRTYRSSHQLHMRRSAMTNSLVRIGTVEGDLLKRALAAPIRPSSHSLRRRSDFQPRPSRLSVMSKAEDS